jgi:thioredoxin-related protein
MKYRTCLLRIVALLLLGVVGARAEETRWLDNYDEAVKTAKAEKKDILMDFTGSDWCPMCIQMEKDVLGTKAFKDYAAKNLVLMRVDFPISKQLPQKLQDQNNDLQEKFGVQGYPTFILVRDGRKVLGQLVGYVDGGPTAFIAKLNTMKK